MKILSRYVDTFLMGAGVIVMGISIGITYVFLLSLPPAFVAISTYFLVQLVRFFL